MKEWKPITRGIVAVILGIFSVWGLFVTIGQLTDTVEINTQVRWLVLMGLCLVTIFGVLLRIIYNEYQYIRSVEEYHLESYDNSSG